MAYTFRNNIGNMLKFKTRFDEIAEAYNSMNERNYYRFIHAVEEMDKINDEMASMMWTALNVHEALHHP